MPTPPRSLAAATIFLVLASPLRAQTRPSPYDIEPLLAKLENPATAQAAAASIPTLPESALEPLYQVSKDKTLDADTRRTITDALPALHMRIMTDRADKQRPFDQKWNRSAGLAIYEKSGHHDPRWDDAVHNALTSIETAKPDAFGFLKTAIDAGCDDPLIRFFYCSRAPDAALDFPTRLSLLNSAIADLPKSPYPPERTIFARILYFRLVKLPANESAFQKLLSQPPATPPYLTAEAMFQAALADLPRLPRDLPVGASNLAIGFLTDAADTLGSHTPDRFFDRTYTALHKAFPQNPFVEGWAAQTLTSLAWDARGSGFANSVTDDGWKLFSQRLDDAEKHALASVSLDPACYSGPTAMLTICMGKSYNNDTLKYWFARAVNGAPNNTFAGRAAVMALLPKWGGSEEEVLAFARDLVQHRPGRLAFVLVDARQDLADDSGDPAAYLKSPDVWADINAAYETVLPDEEKAKSIDLGRDYAHYLRYAARCEQWSDFLALDARFGKDVDVEAFGGEAMLTFYRKKAAAAAAK